MDAESAERVMSKVVAQLPHVLGGCGVDKEVRVAAGRDADATLPPWRCRYCGSRFDTVAEKHKHFFLHGPKPAMCPDPGCGKTFPFISWLKRHVREEHGGAPLFVCETCGESFRCCCDLDAHSMRHSRLMSCPECGESFASRSAYTDHVDQHMGLVHIATAQVLGRALIATSCVQHLATAEVQEPSTPSTPSTSTPAKWEGEPRGEPAHGVSGRATVLVAPPLALERPPENRP